MKRNLTTAALAAALLGAGLAAAAPPTPAGERFLMLNKDGQPSRRCQVLKSWKHPSGGTAYEVKAEDNGEVMTVIEHGTADEPKPGAAAAKAAKPADPLLAPTRFSADNKLHDKVGVPEALKPMAPPAKYTKPPVPASQRWFGRKDVPNKSAAPAPAVPVVVEARFHPDPLVRLIGALGDDTLPSLREIAAETLARDGQGRPEAVEALVQAAKSDPAASVRACCCRCLARMQVKSPECLSALHTLEGDEEVIVRTEAKAALSQLDPK